MTPKKIDVRTTRNGEIVDALCVNSAQAQEINSVLTLAEVGDEVLLIVRPVDIVPNENN